MKYSMAFPYFPSQDIENILLEFREILRGREVLSMGKQVYAFETEFKNYIGTKYAVATQSCTAALEICLKSFGIGPDDEVIVPVQTFIATGSAVARVGARVVFCETDDNFLISFVDIKERITSRTKAVIIVHFAGLIHPHISEIHQYLKKRNIILIEDAAHAPGAKAGHLFAGALSDAACFSFFPTKTITTGEGGMIATNDENIFKMCSSLRNRGSNVWGDSNVFSELGSNQRLSEFQAILGRYQLRRLEEFVHRRNRVAELYRQILSPLVERGDLRFQNYPKSYRHGYWRFSVFFQNDKTPLFNLQKRLAEFGIPIDFPYTPLLHLQPVFRKMYGTAQGQFPFSEKQAMRHFCLPMHTLLEDNDVISIGEILKKELS